MGHIGMHPVREVSVGHPTVTDILEFHSDADRWQTTIFSHLDPLFGLTDGQFVHSDTFAVLIGQSEHLIDAQGDRLGRHTTQRTQKENTA